MIEPVRSTVAVRDYRSDPIVETQNFHGSGTRRWETAELRTTLAFSFADGAGSTGAADCVQRQRLPTARPKPGDTASDSLRCGLRIDPQLPEWQLALERAADGALTGSLTSGEKQIDLALTGPAGPALAPHAVAFLHDGATLASLDLRDGEASDLQALDSNLRGAIAGAMLALRASSGPPLWPLPTLPMPPELRLAPEAEVRVSSRFLGDSIRVGSYRSNRPRSSERQSAWMGETAYSSQGEQGSTVRENRFMVIRSKRIVMRPVCEGDAESLLGVFRNPAVRQYLLDDTLVSIKWVRAEIASSNERFAALGVGLWAIQCVNATNIIGFVGFRDFFDPPRLQLLYGLLPQYWGRGLATEAAERVCEYAFSSGFARIEAATDAPNSRSIAVLNRLGMLFLESSGDAHHGSVFYEIDRVGWYHMQGKTERQRHAVDTAKRRD